MHSQLPSIQAGEHCDYMHVYIFVSEYSGGVLHVNAVYWGEVSSTWLREYILSQSVCMSVICLYVVL